jgi:hypothetical protein
MSRKSGRKPAANLTYTQLVPWPRVGRALKSHKRHSLLLNPVKCQESLGLVAFCVLCRPGGMEQELGFDSATVETQT